MWKQLRLKSSSLSYQELLKARAIPRLEFPLCIRPLMVIEILQIKIPSFTQQTANEKQGQQPPYLLMCAWTFRSSSSSISKAWKSSPGWRTYSSSGWAGCAYLGPASQSAWLPASPLPRLVFPKKVMEIKRKGGYSVKMGASQMACVFHGDR